MSESRVVMPNLRRSGLKVIKVKSSFFLFSVMEGLVLLDMLSEKVFNIKKILNKIY